MNPTPPHGPPPDIHRVLDLAAGPTRPPPIETSVEGDVLSRSPHLKPADTSNLQDRANSLSRPPPPPTPKFLSMITPAATNFLEHGCDLFGLTFTTLVSIGAVGRFDVYNAEIGVAQDDNPAIF